MTILLESLDLLITILPVRNRGGGGRLLVDCCIMRKRNEAPWTGPSTTPSRFPSLLTNIAHKLPRNSQDSYFICIIQSHPIE